MKNVMFLTLFVLVGCGGSGGGSSKGSGSKRKPQLTQPVTNPTLSTVQVTSSTADLVVHVERKIKLDPSFENFSEFGENVNNFVINFVSQSGHYDGAEIRCQKTNSVTDLDARIKTVSFNEEGSAPKVEFGLTKNDPVEVMIDCRVILAGNLLETASLTARKSFYINEVVSASALGLIGSQPIGLLVISENGKLITEGLAMFLSADEIISNGGKIASFERSTALVSPSDAIGLSGKEMNIFTKKAQGKLTFELVGKNGGEQTVVTPEVAAVPASGANGRDSFKMVQCIGQKGATGLTGNKGLPGFNGGSTGSLFLRVAENSSIKIMIDYFAGAGSKGAEGSRGGRGGDGGKGAWIMVMVSRLTYPNYGMMAERHKKCEDGQQGDQGQSGEAGENGKNGNILESKIMIGNKTQVSVQSNWSNAEEN